MIRSRIFSNGAGRRSCRDAPVTSRKPFPRRMTSHQDRRTRNNHRKVTWGRFKGANPVAFAHIEKHQTRERVPGKERYCDEDFGNEGYEERLHVDVACFGP